MAFWDLSEGGSATDDGTKEFDGGGGNFDPIPDGSNVLAVIDAALWAHTQQDGSGAEYIKATWSIVSPDEYSNRKIFHKIWVTDFDPSVKDDAKALAKRDKARKMLAAIDANAGGKLGQKTGKPSNDELALNLCNKPMIITARIWEVDDRNTGATISGNWVSAVAPKSKGIDVKTAAASKPKAQSGGGTGRRDLDDEIPFAPEWRI
jgi:hypothetical protein